MISACLVIRNEDKVLERCLQSIKDIVGEIIVVHDGPCTDNSLEIAKAYGARVFIRNFIGEAEWHRPFSYEQTNGDWILQIDADEYLSKDAIQQVPLLIKPQGVNGYSFYWPYFSGGKYIQKGPFAQTYKDCLFKKNEFHMVGLSHEYARVYGNKIKLKNIQLEHRPLYDNFTKEAFKRKWIAWAQLHARQIADLENVPCYNLPNWLHSQDYHYYDQMRKHPLQNGVIESIRFLGIYFMRGLLVAGVQSWKIALYEIAYLWLVRLSLLKNYARK